MRLKFPAGVGQWLSLDGTPHNPEADGHCDVEEHRLVQALRVGFKIADPWLDLEIAAFQERWGHLIELKPEHFVQNVTLPELEDQSAEFREAVEDASEYVILSGSSVDDVVASLATHFTDMLPVTISTLLAGRVKVMRTEVDADKLRDAKLQQAITEAAPGIARGGMELDYAVRGMTRHFKVDEAAVRERLTAAVDAIKKAATEATGSQSSSPSLDAVPTGSASVAAPDAPAPQGTQGSSPAAEGAKESSDSAVAGGTTTEPKLNAQETQ